MSNQNQTPEEGTEQEKLTPEEEPEQTAPESPEPEPEVEPTETTPETAEPEPEPEPEIDYKKKFAESTRENQILRAKLKNQSASVADDGTPTAREMREKYPDWDDKYPEEQEELLRREKIERELYKTRAIVEKLEREREWEQEVDDFLEKAKILDQYEDLRGKESEFKKFVHKPSHRGVSLDVLAKAFLFKPENVKPKSQKPSQKKTALEKGSGGSKTPRKTELSPEEIRLIRKNDPKRYNLLVRQGKIKISI